MRAELLAFLFVLLSVTSSAQPPEHPVPGADRGKELAELMCQQLPNLTTFPDAIKTVNGGYTTDVSAPGRPVFDDVYDTLTELGRSSVPCLVDQMADTRWMPDPRMEPLLGGPVVGDVAYMVLRAKGVPDFLPKLAHRKLEEMRMDDWFLWPNKGDNRQRLQAAVRAWVDNHPECCAVRHTTRKAAPAAPVLRASATALAAAHDRFSRLRLGMSPTQAQSIVGKPDAVDRDDDNGEKLLAGRSPGLLGFCAHDHNENLAYIYFIERWTKDVLRREPLRDRYVIVYFSARGKLTRLFSNVVEISPVFLTDLEAWERLAWGKTPK